MEKVERASQSPKMEKVARASPLSKMEKVVIASPLPSPKMEQEARASLLPVYTASPNIGANEEEYRDFVKALYAKYKPEMIVSGTAFPTPGAIEIDTTKHAIDALDRLKKKDKELLDNLKKYKHEDADIDKLHKELNDANCILANLENDIDSLKAHKEMNLCLLNKIKNEHKVLRDEKYHLQKQLALARRSCSGQNKRKSKEVDHLNIAYNKLDQKEKSTRRRIAMLEAELSLIISKLEVPKSKKEKPVVPPLDLSKLGEHKVLPPLKNAPKAPRKGVNINSLAKENFTDFNTGNKRRMKAAEPKLSNSTPIMQKHEFVRPAPTARDNRKHPLHPIKTGTLTDPRKQPDKRTVRQVIYKNKSVLTRRDEGIQAEELKLPDIVKGSQLINKSKIVPKQACESRRTAPRRAARKPVNQQKPPFYAQIKASPYFSHSDH
ncbi:unnamed protein product [Mytilus coruscus]|uniref:Uncharacterized protein n=1 Tax=Mytilus coruscus TaxID=42192 RepID=A0A6J8BZ96_MYTCO|nr:unnamed protein product [Mytilus coruscus]